jgi:hypothetical protein
VQRGGGPGAHALMRRATRTRHASRASEELFLIAHAQARTTRDAQASTSLMGHSMQSDTAEQRGSRKLARSMVSVSDQHIRLLSRGAVVRWASTCSRCSMPIKPSTILLQLLSQAKRSPLLVAVTKTTFHCSSVRAVASCALHDA